MISLELQTGVLNNVRKSDLQRDFPEYDLIRQIERYAIRDFMQGCSHHMAHGNVLDFGAGKQPYRKFVAGNYVPFEKGDVFPEMLFDCIICNQVLQFIEDVPALMRVFLKHMNTGGHLIITGGTNWPEVENDDIVRLTRQGMRKYLTEAGFKVLLCESRSELVVYGHFKLSLGFNVLAQRI